MPLSQDNFQCGLDRTDTKVLLLCFTPLDHCIKFQEHCFYNLCIKNTMKNWKASLMFKSHCAHQETYVDICVGRNTAICEQLELLMSIEFLRLDLLYLRYSRGLPTWRTSVQSKAKPCELPWPAVKTLFLSNYALFGEQHLFKPSIASHHA